MIALGFIGEKRTYLRDGWNWLDFIVVTTGVLSALPGVPRVSWLRAFRVLRPLRSLTSVPSMRMLVQSLLNALPGLMNVLALLAFLTFVWGVMGMQSWLGTQRTRCRLTPYPIYVPTAELEPPFGAPSVVNEAMYWTQELAMIGGAPDPAAPASVRAAWGAAVAYVGQLTSNRTAYPFCGVGGPGAAPDGAPFDVSPGALWEAPRDCVWPIDYSDPYLCAMPGSGGVHTCAPGNTCGSNYDAAGHPRFLNARFMSSDVFIVDLGYGQNDFDNIYNAFLQINYATTTSGWTDLMYQVRRRYAWVV